MLRLSGFLALAMALGSPQGGVAANLKPYEAVYAGKLKGFNVRVKRRLQVEGDEIRVTVGAKKLWMGIKESSVLRIHEDGPLYSNTYVHKRRGMSHEHDKDLVFDWNADTVIDLLKPGRSPLPVAEPSYDKLGYQAQMRLDLMRDPNLAQLEYCVTNGVRNRVYSFHRLAAEVLDTPLGKLNTIKFERRGDDDGRQVLVWVAPDWDYLLVRIDQAKKPGDKPERLLLERATVDGNKVTGLPR